MREALSGPLLPDFSAYATPCVPTIRLRVLDSSVQHARNTTTRMLAGLVPAGHLDDVALVVSELVTNAVRAARDAELAAEADGWAWLYSDTPVHLGISCGARWTRLDVTDPDPRPLVVDSGGLLAESGRGLLIVSELAAAYWVTYGDVSKTFHAIVPMTDGRGEPLPLTEDELAEARR